MQGKRWPESTKLTAINLAIDIGAPDAAKQLGISPNAIYQWTAEAGGLKELRALANEHAELSLAGAKHAIANEIARRASDLPDGELAESFRAMLKDETLRLTQAAQGNEAGAAAQATIFVQIQGTDGQPEIVEVPRSRLDEQG